MVNKKKPRKLSKKTILVVGLVASIVLSVSVIVGLTAFASSPCKFGNPKTTGMASCRVVAKGSKGATVKVLQKALNWVCDGSVLTVDGDFGNNTKNKVKSFQTAENISATGYADRTTWQRLDKVYSETYPSKHTVYCW